MKPIRRVSARKYKGLGDVVERVAKPVVRLVDSVFGTDLENCGGCQKRKEFLNSLTGAPPTE